MNNNGRGTATGPSTTIRNGNRIKEPTGNRQQHVREINQTAQRRQKNSRNQSPLMQNTLRRRIEQESTCTSPVLSNQRYRRNDIHGDADELLSDRNFQN